MAISIACVTALAFLFGVNAGSAWAEEINTQVSNQSQINNTNDTSYIITSTSGNGIYADDTAISFGGDATESIKIDASGSNAYGIRTNSSSGNASVELTATLGTIEIEAAARGVGSIASGNNYSASVDLTADVENILRGEIYGISSSASDGGSSSITLNAVGNNWVEATDSTRGGAGIYSNTDYNADGFYSYSSVSLTAGENNTVNGNKYGIYSYGYDGTSEVSLRATNGTNSVTSASDYAISSSGAGDGQSEVSLWAGQDNILEGVKGIQSSGSTGTSKVSLFAGEENLIETTEGDGIYSSAGTGSSEVTLTAQGSNSITAGGSHGIFSYSNGGSSKVALEAAEGDNTVSGSSYGISSYNGSSGSTEVTLTATEGSNKVTSNGIYGIYSWGNNGTSTVTLTAGDSNEVTGVNYGIVSFVSSGQTGKSEVKLTAQSNSITATGDAGMALYASMGSTIELTGATTLTAATGAYVYDRGLIRFNSDVTANTARVAYADGSDSEIYFYEGLTNQSYAEENGPSSIQALNGGAVYVNDNGTGIVNYTGTTNLWAPDDTSTDGTIYMTLGSGSVWYMTGDSSATTLAHSGYLDMTAETGDDKFSILKVNTLSGDGGIIHMDIDASTNTNSDRLLVGTHEGTHYITLNKVGSNTDGAEGTVLVSVGDEQGQFKANDSEGTLYWERYTLASQENTTDEDYSTDWYLADVTPVAPEERETTTLNTVMSTSSLNYHSWMMQNAKLLQRLGDLRQGANDGDNGAWFRISGSKLDLGGQHGFENKYIQYEAGYDKIVAQNSQFTMYGGLAITYADGDSSYNRGDGDNESKAVSLYFTQINKGGSYLDVVFKLGRWENDFKVYDTVGNRITGETESTGMSLSAEYGKKFALGSRGLYIEPQAQLTYGHFDGDNYTLSNGVNVHSEGIESLVGRAGFNLGWDINPRSNVYLKANVLYEFLGDYGITMSDASGRLYKSGDYSDTWFLYGLGASFKLGKLNSGNFLHFDVERSTGGDLDQEWFYNVGFRFEM